MLSSMYRFLKYHKLSYQNKLCC